MTRIEQKKERKREAILRAAWEVFLSEGYLGAGMDRIAKKAGVTKQTVYRYFESKEQLFQACLEARREDNGSEFLKELDREDTRLALSRFAAGFLAHHMSEEHLAGIRLLIAEGPEAPELTRAFYAAGPRDTRTRLARFIEERCHAEDTEYAVRMLLDTLLSMRMGVLVGLHAPPSPEEITEHAGRTVRQFMKLCS
ncbi:TetR family transcriptional regulator [Pseudodesulfovibrio cashew]|uniref:TetR family transcriptional regulator n=1 Tax=Pseudodesulfovibrio cashew TaxID=2678688 RepID=A0A6I6JA99_9BACT|nr:TetR/AcrR family transcriptional regulator [Pseudodesulfovibrio cashew]QGY39686.1 TetR family transcriptional regulator [Pseudodesulfovibrio cashew]